MVREVRLFLRENKVMRKTIYPFVVWGMTRVLRWRQYLVKKYGYQATALIHQTASEIGVVYYADFGTLLGFVRDGGFIAHDADMDFAIMPNSGKISVFFEELEKKNFYFERYITIDGTLNEFTMRYHEVSIDFFVKRYNNTKTHFHALGSDKGDYYYSFNIILPKGFTVMKVHGVEVQIPANYEEMLDNLYGNWNVKIKNWDDSMSPAFSKDYAKHMTYLSRNRDEWVKFLSDRNL